MKTGKLVFERLVQDSQDFGSDDEHMVSRVFFSLTIDNDTHTGLFANIKQTVGSSYETGPLEVSRPENYNGPFNFSQFQKYAEQYYRSQVGASGSGIHIGPGATNIRMRNNTFVRPFAVEIPIKDSENPW